MSIGAALEVEVAPDSRILPPRDRRATAEAIAKVYGECAKCAEEKRDADLIAAADTLSLFVSSAHAANTQLQAIRMWKVNALANLGRGREALELLNWIEGFNGVSFKTRERKARLLAFAGDSAGCIDACTDAIMALPLDKKTSREFRRLCLARADAMNACGRHDDALRLMFETLRGVVPTYDELLTLRRAVKTPEALEQMFLFLAPHFSYSGHRARHALLHYSVACRDLGLLDRAIFAARQRFLAGLQIVRYGEREQQIKEDWTAQALTTLLDLRADLGSLGIEFFLISGTLLGCVREGTILSYDKDIDVGVLTDVPPETIRKTLASSGRFKVRALTTDHLVQVEHANGVMLDVFLHWREDGRIYHQGQKTRWWNSDFELQKVEFLGGTFKIPTNPDQYLIENYGDSWSIPQPEFETFVDTPNMIIQDNEHMIWYFFTRLHDYYFAGKRIQLFKVWDALQELIGHDAAVAHAMERIKLDAAQPPVLNQ
ncbi:hypothetical protein ACIKT0_00475 [Hansschlegelia beijingensis]|uniref:hypothetical protein n=1 Tax=Hansschlegelia beijingensis TaxID=1133344 RepID=UPI00387F22B5